MNTNTQLTSYQKDNHIAVLMTAMLCILGSYAVYLFTMFVTHLIASTKDMPHEQYYGTVVLAATKVVDEMNGPLALLVLVLILLATNLLVSALQLPVNPRKKLKLQSIFLVTSGLLIAIQLLLTFELGIFPIGMALVTFGSSVFGFSVVTLVAARQVSLINRAIITHLLKSVNKYEWSGLFLLTFFALPWIFAHLGFYISDFDILGLPILFIARQEYKPEPNYPSAVHIGTHHGFSSYWILVYGLMALKWIIPFISSNRVRNSTQVIASLALSYGLYNYLEDLITEQIYKRSWIDFRLPSGGTPNLNFQTLVMVLVGLGIYIWLQQKEP